MNPGFWPPPCIIEFQVRRSIKSSSLSLSSNPVLVVVASDDFFGVSGCALVKWQILGSCITAEVVQLRSGLFADCFTNYRPVEKYFVFADCILSVVLFFFFLDRWKVKKMLYNFILYL